MSMIEEVAAMKQEQEAQRGDLVRINSSINELTKALQGTTAAINDLSAKYDLLMHDLQKQTATQKEGITPEQVQAIVAKELHGIQLDGKNVFDPLREKAAELSKEFNAAGRVALKQIKEAGKPDRVEILAKCMLTAIFYVLINCGVMYLMYGIDDIHSDLSYIRDRVNAIHYNQTIEDAKFTPWDMKEFHEAWDNQNKYIWEQRNKKAQ